MALCACGCGETIEPLAHHKYKPVRFKPNHFTRAGLTHLGKRTSALRIPPGTVCSCGCGEAIPEFRDAGTPRYAKSTGGRFYVFGHHMRLRTGDLASQWKGGRMLSSSGYVLLRMPGHHLAEKGGWVREHRLVWEQANGQPLPRNKDVHHLNGIKDDNRPENLIALTRYEHGRLHGRGRSSKDEC